MAYTKKRRNKKKTYAQKASELRDFAYKLGQVEKGRKDSDTQVYDSFNKGFSSEKSKKKRLY